MDNMIPVTHAILTAFRDFGARANRQKARMMWLIDDMGMPAWRAEVGAGGDGVRSGPVVCA